MPTAVRSVLSTWVSEVQPDQRTLLSAREQPRSHLKLSASHNVESLCGSMSQSDAAFLYAWCTADGEWNRDSFPSVAFEVESKQRHEKVVEVAREWFTRPAGRIEVVTVVNIEKDAITTKGTEEDKDGSEMKSVRALSNGAGDTETRRRL